MISPVGQTLGYHMKLFPTVKNTTPPRDMRSVFADHPGGWSLHCGPEIFVGTPLRGVRWPYPLSERCGHLRTGVPTHRSEATPAPSLRGLSRSDWGSFFRWSSRCALSGWHSLSLAQGRASSLTEGAGDVRSVFADHPGGWSLHCGPEVFVGTPLRGVRGADPLSERCGHLRTGVPTANRLRSGHPKGRPYNGDLVRPWHEKTPGPLWKRSRRAFYLAVS